MIANRAGTTKQAWRAHVQICPVTSGLETKMTCNGFSLMCAKFRKAAKTKDSQPNSGDPYAKWCRKCKGKILPAELEFIEIN